MTRRPPNSTLFPYPTPSRVKKGKLAGLLEGYQRISQDEHRHVAYGTWFLQQKAADPAHRRRIQERLMALMPLAQGVDRKSTRLNSSHANISYAVFCLKKKKY